MSTWCRIVYVVQWPFAVLMPVWWFFQPGSFHPGTSMLLALIASPVLTLMMLLSGMIATAVRPNKEIHAVSRGYAILAPLSWLSGMGVPLTVAGGGSSGSFPSTFETFGANSDTVNAASMVLLVSFLVFWVAGLILAWLPRSTT